MKYLQIFFNKNKKSFWKDKRSNKEYSKKSNFF